MARALKQNWLSTLCDLALERPGQYCRGMAPVHWTALQAARPPIDTGSLSPPSPPSPPPVLLHHHQDEEEGQVDGMMTATMMVRPQPMEHYVPEPRRLLLLDDDDGAEEDRDGDADDEEERTNSQVRCQRRRASDCSSTRAGKRRGRRQGSGRGRVSDVNLLRSIYASIACNARRAAVTPLCAARQRLSWAMAATATITSSSSSSSSSIRCAHAFTEQSQYRLFIVGHTSR